MAVAWRRSAVDLTTCNRQANARDRTAESPTCRSDRTENRRPQIRRTMSEVPELATMLCGGTAECPRAGYFGCCVSCRLADPRWQDDLLAAINASDVARLKIKSSRTGGRS